MQAGPIGPHLLGFAALVSQQGYCSVTGWLKVRLIAKFGRWLQQHRVPLSELNEAKIAAFFRARWKRLKRQVGDQTTTALLLRHLRQANVLPPPPEAGTGSDTDLLCAEYGIFLLRTAVVEASSDLAGAAWLPISTNVLSIDSLYVRDPFWTNISQRLYRIRSP